MTPLLLVLGLWAAFLGTHLLFSHPPVRGPLVARMGANAFRGAYSVLSLALFVPLSVVWWQHRHEGGLWWSLRDVPGLAHGAELLALLGFALVGGGVARPAPSSVAAQLQHLGTRVVGMTNITRHPVFMGLALWAGAHLLVNGWGTDVVYYGGFVVTSVVGSLHQDWRLARENPDYALLVEKTTFLPIGPLTRGTTAFGLGATTWIGVAVGMATGLGLRLLHPVLFAP